MLSAGPQSVPGVRQNSLPSFSLTPGALRLPRPSLLVERGKALLAGLGGEWEKL